MAIPSPILAISRNLMDDQALVEAGVALTRLVVRNERQSLRIEEQLAEVRASRARIVEAADAERRRIERDLHDGLQQRMVALAMQLRAANGDSAHLDAALRGGSVELLEILDDVRELARGIHPAVLTEAGLGAAIRAAADRSPVPAEVDLRLAGRGTPAALATVYYVVSEALANVAKHAREATGVWVRADDGDGTLRVVIEDDGPGGADPSGHGLAGLADRIAALDGRFAVEAVDGGGTKDRGRGPGVVNDVLRIAVADDNVLLRAGIVRILEGEGWAVTAEVGRADELVAAVRRDVPDVAVVDIRMPPGDGDGGSGRHARSAPSSGAESRSWSCRNISNRTSRCVSSRTATTVGSGICSRIASQTCRRSRMRSDGWRRVDR